METLIFERGNVTIPGLSDVDALFSELQTSELKQQRAILSKLEDKLTKIFGVTFIVEVHTYGEFADNFAILPILKPENNSPSNQISNTSIKLNKLDMAYIFMGNEILHTSKPTELTAILLHEVGHLTEHISAMQNMFMKYISKVNYFADVMSRYPIINFVFSPLFFITNRSLSFTNHAYEYHADRFAVRYGYGDELANWCKANLKHEKKANTKVSTFMKITNVLNSVFDAATHPSFDKRIREIVNEMKTNYPKQYKSKQIKSILDKHYKL